VVGDGEQFDTAALHLRLDDREAGHHHLNAAFAEIGAGLNDVAIGHFREVELRLVDKPVPHEFGDARHQCGVELAGLRTGARDQIRKRSEIHRCRHPDRNDGVGDARDRDDVAVFVGNLVVLVGVRREASGGREQQRVIVVGSDEGRDRHEAVAARPVFDDDRLSPARREPLGEQACADVGAGPRSKRHDEFDGVVGPGLAGQARCRQRQHRGGNRARSNPPHGFPLPSFIGL
jgi:hypothetical protein